MTALKSVLLCLLMSHYVQVNCQDPNPCQRVRNGKVRHPTSCIKYYDCANYRAKPQTCKSTEHYSTKARGCVPIQESSCIITTTPVALTTDQATTIRIPESVTRSGSVSGSESGSGSVSGSAPGSFSGSRYESVSGSVSGSGSAYVTGSGSGSAYVTGSGSVSASVTGSVSGSRSESVSETVPGSQNKCSPNQTNLNVFDKYEHSGKTYYLYKYIYTSDVVSAAMCETLCGYLAEIEDQDEFDFVVSLNAKHNYYGILVAGTDKYTEGTWAYERTLKSVTYFNWCLDPKEPNNDNDQDCMGVSKKYPCMFDHQCESHHNNFYSFRYLCEVDKNTD